MKYQSKDRKLGTRQNIKMVGDFLDARARTAIDIGCDEGTIAVHLHHLGLKVDAVEAAPDVAEEAKQFIAANQAQVKLTTKILTIDDVEAMPAYDVVCFLSVYHQVVEHNGFEYANRLLAALYRKTNLQFFFQPCMIHLKHRTRMPFVENNTADALEFFTTVLRSSGLPVAGQFVGYSLNGLPAADPFRPMFLFEKKKGREVFAFPAMARGRIDGQTPSRLLYIDLDQTVSAHALTSFSLQGWHPFTAACSAIGARPNPALTNGAPSADAVLAEYYGRFQPRNFGDVWRHAGLTTDIGLMAKQPTRHRCNWLPWSLPTETPENMKAGRTTAQAWPDNDCHAYGPVSAKVREAETERLHGLFSKLAGEGYEPEVNHDGYVRGQLLVRGEESRFLVSAGQHRLAALANLGYKHIVAKFQPGAAKVIDLAEVRQWPQVANGTYTPEQATNIFNGIFEATGLALRDRLRAMAERPAITLPAVKPYRLAATRENGWSDQYGALHVAAAHAGMTMPERYALSGFWQHGCDGPWYEFSPDLLCNNTPNARQMPVFVAREEQADYLRAHGFAQARAIGLPIAYTAPSGVARLPRSLLVLPTHTLAGEQAPNREAFDRYASEIAAVAGEFERVVICVHPNCRKNGFWVQEFASRGFEIVDGAFNGDLQALARVRALFEQFECVTTNGWGSHVAYALAFGARVSIHGTQPTRTEEDFLKDATWAADRAALKTMLSDDTKAKERAFLQPLHRHPCEGVPDVNLGRWLIGADLKLTPEEMRAVLAAIVTPAPRLAGEAAWAQAEQAREVRTQARVQAREFLQAGRRGDAVRVLINAAKADVASRIPVVIVEGLVEIGDDLASLEPKHSAMLLGQAEKLGAANGIDVAALRARLVAA